MGGLLKNILLMSTAGGALALFLLCIKPVTRKYFSPGWQYYIWLTVLLVMILPLKFSFPAKQAEAPPVHLPVQTGQSETIQENTESVQTPALHTPSERPAIRIPELPVSIIHIFGVMWLGAVLLIFGYRITKYLLFLRTIHNNSVTDDHIGDIPPRLTVRRTELLDAPLIVGLVKPVLYLPQGEIEQENLAYILLHELTHYRRKDILYKWFAMLVSSLHWFNPFVYMVSKQIDEACEISCDAHVCKQLTEAQKNRYMKMILDLAGTSVRKKRPLTTQMASNKKTLIRRFTMIKNKKATGKMMSILSGFIAAILLSTTGFASGVLADWTTDDYTIDLFAPGGEKIELTNPPFVENGCVYLPLRETLEKAGVMESAYSYITWDDGKIVINLTHDHINIAYYSFEIGGNTIALKHITPNETVTEEPIMAVQLAGNGEGAGEMKQKGSLTYVPIESMNYMLYSFLNIKDADGKLCKLSYHAYDKDGHQLNIQQTAREVAEQYLRYIEQNQPEKAVSLCTHEFVEIGYDANQHYFTASSFGMDAIRINDIEEIEYDYDENTVEFLFRYTNLDILKEIENGTWQYDRGADDISILALKKQPDGSYLVNEHYAYQPSHPAVAVHE